MSAEAAKIMKEQDVAETDVERRDWDEAWARVKKRLRTELGDDVFTSWFARIECDGVAAGVVSLSAPTLFLKGWIKSHYSDRLVALWNAEYGDVRRVDVVKRSPLKFPAQVKVVHSEPAPAQPQAAQEDAEDRFAGSPLDARLTFTSFCEGTSNEVAFRAAKAVATAPDGAPPLYNPLYLHAGVGIGKTHLLQAIAHETRKLHPQRRVMYLTVERFTFQFVAALRDKAALDFKEKLRSIDILLIDDMQFLTGRSVQQEFCHMLNALLDSSKQVVVAADRAPGELDGIDERVRSRLKGGVVVGMARPDTAMRRKILDLRLAAARERDPKIQVPDNVLDFIARMVVSNGRDLDGALNRLICRAQFSDQPISVDACELAIADLIGDREPKRIRIEDIQKIVARHYNVSRQDLVSARRTRTVVRPRQIAMYLAKTMTPRSFPEIGKRFGGRDHTTVLHAVRKIEGLVGADQKLSDEIELLRRLLQD
ncbi:chromosomal replication initiator protein DnaA [Afifella sp. JA880]|uniref:chromosomal replication initiator protein DnaA n=1 Tax=Afifella sp. JA880 TaxID=2975280 RepID=UPI0021BAA190|nr:chromosomal replication initiator protein DnaA [Afifella sp. JA880]MCT8268309.1 chromosomal replication initiator protein DnaA [Afifella sp. JA880]